MKKILCFIFIGLCSSYSADVKAADTYTITGDLLIDNPIDARELGVLTSVLTPFEVSISFDPSNAFFNSFSSGNAGVEHIFRGLSSTATIGGSLNSVEGRSGSTVRVIDGGSLPFFADGIGFNASGQLDGAIYEDFLFSFQIDTMRLDVINGLEPNFSDTSSARFVRDIATSFPITNGQITLRDFDTFNSFSYGLSNLSVSVSSVPEPATWLMMILGFGIVGFALRRRTRASIVA